MTKPTKPRRYRRHGDAPANWQFRPRPDGTGRPRWIPAPGLRKAGWRARDLKDEQGAFLSEGLSRDLAREINAAVDAWRRGELVPAAFADIAPEGAAEQAETARPVAVDRLSIGRLLDAYFDSREFQGSPDNRGQQVGGLKPSTQRSYRTSLKRLVDTLAGFVALPAKDDPDALDRYDMAVAIVRASKVTTFAPSETDQGVVDLLYTAYWKLHAHVGKHQAYAVLAAASAWLAWCRRHQSRSIQNWAAEVRRDTPPGRIRPWTVEEFKTMVATADAMGLPSIGDAIVLGLDLSWSQVDRLSLTWDRLKNGRALTGVDGRQKTGRVGGTPLTSLGRARVAQIIERQRAMPAKPTHVLWCEATGKPWQGDFYRKQFAEVRAEAAKTCPSLLIGPPSDPDKGAGDADLRDTAFTWMKNAEINDDGIASRTLQSRKHIAQLGDANYGEIGPEIADRAGRQFDAYLIKSGVVL